MSRIAPKADVTEHRTYVAERPKADFAHVDGDRLTHIGEPWYDSPAYREVREHRYKGADYRAVIVQGVSRRRALGPVRISQAFRSGSNRQEEPPHYSASWPWSL